MPAVPEKEVVYPPERAYFFPPFQGSVQPGILVVPPLPTTPPPCPDDDEDCKPPEPPVDVPEPGTLVLLMIGVATVWLARRPRKATARSSAR